MVHEVSEAYACNDTGAVRTANVGKFGLVVTCDSLGVLGNKGERLHISVRMKFNNK